MKFLLKCLINVLLWQGLLCLLMKDIDVPSMFVIDDDNEDTIKLNCDYDLEDDNRSLVVKWLKNNKAIYQWIRGNKPAIIPPFKGDIDDTYEASEDPDHLYSGLALINPSIETTGTYKCVVQTGNASLSLEKKLQIVDIRNYTIHLYHNKIQNETHVECTVNNVYPEPTIHLNTDDDDEVSIITEKVNEDDNGLYNATTIAVVSDDDDDDDAYLCTVTFLDLPMNLTTAATSGAYTMSVTTPLVIFFLSLWFIH